jgi:hypothetical protein
VLGDGALERVDQPGEVVDAEVGVGLGAAILLQAVEGPGEDVVLDPEHGGAEHLQQPAVGVQGEPFVVALLRQPPHRLVVEAYVEDGVHHSRHRVLGARAHADEQRVGRVTQPSAHRLLECVQVLVDLGGQALGHVAHVEERPAGLGRDREARRHGETQVGHLGEVGTLAPEQVLLVLVAL